MIETPYLLFLGDAPDQLAAKVAQGIKDWRPENAVGQLRMDGCKADLGLKDMDLIEAREAGAKTLVIGVANRGGVISKEWKKVLVAALEEGFDLASGLHNLLRDEPDLVAVAEATGQKLHDVRVPEVDYEIAYDFPADEWRRVQRAEGYRWIMVNGVTTFRDGVCTEATPGQLLRLNRWQMPEAQLASAG